MGGVGGVVEDKAGDPEPGLEAEAEVELLLVMSARRPKAKQRVEMDMPIIVRNWRCHPYEEFFRWLVCAREC